METDWSDISDAALRKRIQNRLAQRKHRRKAKEQAACQSDATTSPTPTTASRETTPSWQSIASDPNLPPSFSPVLEAMSIAGARVDDGYDAQTIGKEMGEFMAVPTFARQTWNPGAGDDILHDTVLCRKAAGAEGDVEDPGLRYSFHTDRRPPASHQFSPKLTVAHVVSPNLGASPPSFWDTMPLPETEPHQQHRQQQHAPYPATIICCADSSDISSPVMSIGFHNRGSSEPRASSSVQRMSNCFECGAQHRSSRHGGGSMESASTNVHRGIEGRSPVATPSHVSPASSSLTQSSASDILRQQDIDLAQILSHIDIDKRHSAQAISRALLTTPQCNGQFPDGGLSNMNSHTSTNQHHDNQPMGIDAPKANTEPLENTGRRVTKVVVIYMDERSRG